jgi:hypothetical protein
MYPIIYREFRVLQIYDSATDRRTFTTSEKRKTVLDPVSTVVVRDLIFSASSWLGN